MPGIVCEFHEGFGCRTEKYIVHGLLVHGNQRIQCRGDGEDHVEVWDGQEILTACLDPLFLFQSLAFGTVAVPAGVVRYLHMAAAVAHVHMAAESRSPAYLDSAHDPHMIAGQPV